MADPLDYGAAENTQTPGWIPVLFLIGFFAWLAAASSSVATIANGRYAPVLWQGLGFLVASAACAAALIRRSRGIWRILSVCMLAATLPIALMITSRLAKFGDAWW